jgi:hypothetical protein
MVNLLTLWNRLAAAGAVLFGESFSAPSWLYRLRSQSPRRRCGGGRFPGLPSYAMVMSLMCPPAIAESEPVPWLRALAALFRRADRPNPWRWGRVSPTESGAAPPQLSTTASPGVPTSGPVSAAPSSRAGRSVAETVASPVGSTVPGGTIAGPTDAASGAGRANPATVELQPVSHLVVAIIKAGGRSARRGEPGHRCSPIRNEGNGFTRSS